MTEPPPCTAPRVLPSHPGRNHQDGLVAERDRTASTCRTVAELELLVTSKGVSTGRCRDHGQQDGSARDALRHAAGLLVSRRLAARAKPPSQRLQVMQHPRNGAAMELVLRSLNSVDEGAP